MKPRALDLFCKAGGVSRGLQLAGYHVTGVDIAPQPHYAGDVFIQADALTFDLSGYDLITASPPCQFASEQTPLAYRALRPNLIPATRTRLQAAGVPYIIENVENARRHLINPIMLCGTMFGLPVWMHRYFEISPALFLLTPPCDHSTRPVTRHPGSNSRKTTEGREDVTRTRRAMQIDWMTSDELDEAIPPAYAEYLGRAIMPYVLHGVAA